MKNIILIVFAVISANAVLANDSVFYFKTSDSVRLYVRAAGSGKPCLFVHGGPGSTSYYFEAMSGAPLVEQKLRMVYYDQRGSGRSDSARSNDYSLNRMLKDMEELRIALGYTEWSVMGHSFAGILLSNYATKYSGAVTSLMLIHCTLNMGESMQGHIDFGLNELKLDPAVLQDTQLAVIDKVSIVHEELSKKDIWYKLMYRNKYEKEFNDSVTFSVSPLNRDFAMNVWNVDDYWKDFTPLTKNIKCPVLVMAGEKDYAIGLLHYRKFSFPDQTTILYIGGHAPFQEEPQWFAEKILDFVSKRVMK